MDVKITQLEYQGKHITLIPTAHVSKESAELVERTINEIQPDAICIELDQDRYNSMTNPEKYRNTDIVKIIKEKKVALLLVNLILANYQKRMAASLDSQTGKEMLIGIEKSKELNCELVLADRNVQTTFKRVWANLNAKDKFKLIELIINSLFEDEEISEEDLKNLQTEDALNNALAEVSQQFPHISEVLVEERDKYLAHKIKHANGNNIVAILGAAHTINVPKYIQEEYEIKQFDVVPPKKTSSKIIGWIIPALIVIAVLLSFKLDSSMGLEQIKSWIICNGTLGALGALLAGGSIPSILVAFVASPITSLNPLLACGWFAGLAEAKIRKPAVKDFEDLNNINSIKDFYKNKVCRILLLVILANLGSSIGTFISGIDIIKNIIDKI